MDNKLFTCRATYSVDDSYVSDKFIKLRVKICHTGQNLNGSVIDVDTLKAALPTLANSPILAHVVKQEDGTYDFAGHDMKIIPDPMNEGEYRIEYLEVPVGVFPADNLELVIVEEGDRHYLYANAYVWRGYSNLAGDIIAQRETADVSMEIAIDAYEYSEQDNLFYITAFQFAGVTLLGANKTPAMEGAEATTKFSVEENDEKLAKLLFALSKELCNNPRKEGDTELPKTKNTVPVNEKEKQEIPAEEMETMNTQTEDVGEVTPAEEMAEIATFSASYEQRRESLRQIMPCHCDETSEMYCYLLDFDDQYAYVEKHFWTIDKHERTNGRFAYKFDEVTQSAELTSDFERMIVKWLTVEEAAKLEESRNVFTEVEELRAYKRGIETEQVFAEFPDLVENEQFMALKQDNTKFSIEELKRECYVIRGMAHVPAAQDDEETAPKISVKHIADEPKNTPYNGVFEAYGITKKN